MQFLSSELTLNILFKVAIPNQYVLKRDLINVFIYVSNVLSHKFSGFFELMQQKQI